MHFIADAFREGGFGMYLIAATSIFVVAIIAERVNYLYFKTKFDKDAFVAGMKKYILQGNLSRALAYCGSLNSPLATIVRAGLLKVHKTDGEVQAAMDEASLRELPKIEHRTGYLAMLGNVATLLGLLGTITGMIRSFAAVAASDPSEKATRLALGIAEALNCTAFGLLVAVPALVAFSVLNGRTQVMLDEVNEASVSVLNLIVANRDKLDVRAVVEAEKEVAAA